MVKGQKMNADPAKTTIPIRSPFNLSIKLFTSCLALVIRLVLYLWLTWRPRHLRQLKYLYPLWKLSPNVYPTVVWSMLELKKTRMPATDIFSSYIFGQNEILLIWKSSLICQIWLWLLVYLSPTTKRKPIGPGSEIKSTKNSWLRISC